MPLLTRKKLCFYTCLSVILFTGRGVSQHALQVSRRCVSQHALQVSNPTPSAELEGSHWGDFPSPHPGGKLRGLAWGWGSLQAHSQGGLQALTGESPGKHCWGTGVSQYALKQTQAQLTATAGGDTHPTGMHSCLTILTSYFVQGFKSRFIFIVN